MFRDAKKGLQKDVVLPFIELILEKSMNDGVDKIVFGEPCDDLPRVTLQAAMASNPGLAKLVGLSDELCTKTKDVPIWQRVHGTWHELAGIPWYLLHEVVRNLGDRIVAQQTDTQRTKHTESLDSIVHLKSGSIYVGMSLTLEPNYCYSITLRKID
jgi:hypothetical protein